jgi:hypothetical protein
MAIKRYVQLADYVNHHRIGCSLAYFIQHLEDKPLRVIEQTPISVTVRDEEQKTYILSVTEVQPVMVKP